MDDELERLRRLRQVAPGDVTSALRLSSNLERVGRVADAFDLLARLAGSVSQGEKGLELRHALAALADRHPTELLEHVRGQPYRAASYSLKLLAECGAIAIPIVLGCSKPLHPVNDNSAPGRLLRPAAMRALARTMPGRGLEDALPDAFHRTRVPAWVPEEVRRRREWALLPWLSAVILENEGVRNPFTNAARAAFLLLAGREPPLDLPVHVEDVAARIRAERAAR